MKILIIKLSAFGDIIHALPALDDLLQRPEVDEIHWLIDARFAFVAELLPATVTPHIVTLKGKGGVRNGWAMVEMLRQHHFDLVLDLQGLIKSGMIARAIGAPAYGFDGKQSPEWPNRWLVKPVPFHHDEQHVVQCYRRIAAAPFAHSPAQAPAQAMAYRSPVVSITNAMKAQSDAIRQQWQLANTFALCHIGGSYATKRLPNETWRILLAKLGQQQPTVVLWGNHNEQTDANAVTMNIPGVFAAKTRLPIGTLAALLHEACGYIGPDSGVTHLAAAVGCPTVTMWGPTAPWRMGAKGMQHLDIIAENNCAPCFKRSCNQFVCMPALRAEKIYHLFSQTIKNRSGLDLTPKSIETFADAVGE